MKSAVILAALGGLALGNAPGVSAAETTTFIIDPANSYVRAYVFNGWVNEGSTWDSSDVYWRVDWALSTFQLSGSFTVDTVASGANPDWTRLYITQNESATDAPDYASFYLPDFFSKTGESFSYSSHPCFDTGFYAPPGESWSCSGGEMGQTRSDEGSLVNGVLVLDGAISEPRTFGALSAMASCCHTAPNQIQILRLITVT
jgi:hypothetical protein